MTINTDDSIEHGHDAVTETLLRIAAEQSRDRWMNLYETHMDQCEPGHARCSRELAEAVEEVEQRAAEVQRVIHKFWIILTSWLVAVAFAAGLLVARW